MIEAGAARKIDQIAQSAAHSTDGDVERMLHDMEKYGVEGVSSGISFGIAHIPFVGPALAKGYDLGAAAGIARFYKSKLAEANTREERIQYATSYLERSLAGDIRKCYNTLASFREMLKSVLGAPPNDCQEAHEKAYRTHLADACVEDLREWAAILAKLAEDMEGVANGYTPTISQKKLQVDDELGGLYVRHPPHKCNGTRKCYWVPDPVPVQGTQVSHNVRVPYVGSNITNEDL